VTMLFNILIKNESSVYNIGGKSVVTIRDLAVKVGELMEVAVRIPETDSYMPHAPNSVGLDLTRVEGEYGNILYTDIDVGLINTIKWIRALQSES